MTPKIKLITAKDFLEWLEKQDDKEPVGYTKDPESCPIANYYKATHPGCNVGISAGTVRVTHEYDSEIQSHPAWVREFVRELDQHSFSLKVSKTQALEVFFATTKSSPTRSLL